MEAVRLGTGSAAVHQGGHSSVKAAHAEIDLWWNFSIQIIYMELSSLPGKAHWHCVNPRYILCPSFRKICVSSVTARLPITKQMTAKHRIRIQRMNRIKIKTQSQYPTTNQNWISVTKELDRDFIPVPRSPAAWWQWPRLLMLAPLCWSPAAPPPAPTPRPWWPGAPPMSRCTRGGGTSC